MAAERGRERNLYSKGYAMYDTQIHTAHLEPLFALSHNATEALVGMLGSHFVSHGVLDRATLVRYVAEAEAVAS